MSSETNYAYVCTSQSIEILQDEAAQPGPGCPLFDLLAGKKVLTHRYDSRDAYPPGQVQDAQMTITLKARRADPGSTIYLQVSDPPDSSAYGGPHSAGDNVDTTTPNVGTIGGNTQVTAVLPASGETSTLVLTTTPYAAGDNYRVVGSVDPQLLTNPSFQCTDCPDTGVITAWKRVYLEQDKMFRKGVMFAQDAPAGSTQIHVANVSSFTATKGKTLGSSIVLVHAPTLPGGPIYYEPGPGDPPLIVAKIDKKNSALTLSRPISQSYLATNDPTKPWRADGVGVVTGVESADFFTPNTSLIASLYSQGFVEIVAPPRASADPGYVPFTANFTDPQVVDVFESGRRWCRNYGNPNVLCSIGGARSGTDLGVRRVGEPVAWTWVAEIESKVGSSHSGNLNAESSAHEFTHTWDPNSSFNMSGHCDELQYQNHGLRCLMQPVWSDATGTIYPEFYDGVVAFHYNVNLLDPSEYVDIRRHQEPLP